MKEIRNWQLDEERPFWVMKLEQPDSATQPHIHDCFQVAYCIEGSGVCTVEGKIFPFTPGAVYIVTPNEYHFLQSTKGQISKWRFIYVEPTYLLKDLTVSPEIIDTSTFWGAKFKNVILRAEHPELSSLVKMALDEIEQKKTNWKYALSGIFCSILVLLHRLPGQEKVMPKRQIAMSRVAAAIYEISKNYGKPLSMTALAKQCNMSASTFDRIFRQATGCAPGQYLLNFRVYRAADLINNSGYTILEASHAVGFSNVSSLYRQFKKTFGCSPSKLPKSK